ncbi:nucleoporin Nup120/160-domain-containing protein [Apiosordaria backusii]|uniref:Nucleoporin Nup120/160-domain-containing protein n=1 Tax=Apiosordaria backusii TaxID=314023 RepID=A0AA40BNS9_9PEZI|nr:nucleoporin Nup120/160-domain-containing protein [Apiosordaria backusii]
MKLVPINSALQSSRTATQPATKRDNTPEIVDWSLETSHGGKMTSRNFEILYKEARLNLEPASPSSVIQLRVAPQSAYGRSSSSRTSTDDEKGYRSKSLATASSIYYRKHHTSPRAFLWRVLENGTVLSIRAADVCKQQQVVDAPLILNLRFPSTIHNSCIGFADPKDTDALCVFVVDQSNQLYSITLRPDLFRKKTASDGGLGDACRVYSPPGFGFKHPHRLAVVNSDQLIVTMHDGGILKFDRNKTHDVHGSPWKETIYNVAGWGQSLRGLVPFQRNPTVRYEKINMELTAAVSTAVATMGLDNTAFLFTICLDHRMRVWDVRTGQILYTGDILNANRDVQEGSSWNINPSQSNLIRILDTAKGECLVATFSPVGNGEFKFWKVKANDQGSIHVADYFADAQLIPPSPSSMDIWSMADFAVTKQPEGPELWALWKNNTSYRVHRLQLHPRNGSAVFNDGWKTVYIENSVPVVEASGPWNSVDSTEKWLDLIFFPGRFSKATLETALAVYEKGLGTYKETTSRVGKSIAESICSVLGSTAALGKTSAGSADYEQFRGTSETQWMRFWRLLLELDKQRGEALSLVYDLEEGMVWTACADLLAAVRQCSDMDRVYHNLSSPEKKDEDVAALVSAGLTFVEGFNDSTTQLSRAALRAELFQESSLPDSERMQLFLDRAGFWSAVGDDDIAQVTEILGQNYRTVTSRLYEDLFDLVTATSEANSQELREQFTGFGRKVIVRSVQDTVELHWQILFSQLILLVHMEFDIENEDESPLHSRFDVGSIYRRLIAALRRLEHLRWMVKTELNIPARVAVSSGISSPQLAKRGQEETHTVTALEGLTGHLYGLPENNDEPLFSAITDLVLDLCAPGSTTVLQTSLLQRGLLKHDRPDLALELTPFADQDPFSIYVQGRVFLAHKDYDTAAYYFRRAAIGLSITMKHMERHSSGLLDDTEWNLFNSGLPNYYSHIVTLFERQKAYSYVMEFSRLALQFVQTGAQDSANIKTEMLSRLFTASTAISHFEEAHSALLQMQDEALQKSYLRKLVEKMCETGQNRQLISLPFSGLQPKVDDILLEKCKATRDVLNGVPYHQILYAWRISHNDYRGGAAILLDRLQKLRQAGEGDKINGINGDALDTQVTRQYLLLINALNCVPPEEAYILEDISPQEKSNSAPRSNGDDLDAQLEDLSKKLDAENAVNGTGEDEEDAALLAKMKSFLSRPAGTEATTPRRLLTLADIRKNYQLELDRIVAIQNNQFAITGDGGEDGGYEGEVDMMDIA